MRRQALDTGACEASNISDVTFAWLCELNGSSLRGFGREVLERHDQLPSLAAKSRESVVSEEILCSLVLGINHKRKNCKLRSRRTHSSVGEQGGTELVAVKGLIDGQASDSRNRNGQRDALSRGQKSTA